MAPSFAGPLAADGAALGTGALLIAMAGIYGGAWQQAKALRLKEAQLTEAASSGKKPRIGAFDSLRRLLSEERCRSFHFPSCIIIYHISYHMVHMIYIRITRVCTAIWHIH